MSGITHLLPISLLYGVHREDVSILPLSEYTPCNIQVAPFLHYFPPNHACISLLHFDTLNMGENTDALTYSNSETDGICSCVNFCWSGRLDDCLRPHIKRNLLIDNIKLNIYFKRLLYIDDFP
jgi:hypothetical protein